MINEALKIDNTQFRFDEKVTKEDVQKVLNLIAEVGVFSDEEIKISGELVEETLKNPEAYQFIFLRDAQDNLLAYSCYGEICMAKNRFDLYWIAVSKKWQNQKLASLVFDKTEIEIKKLGGKKIYAETSSLLSYAPARNFYLKSGFAKVAEMSDFYKDGDNKVIFCKDI
jgi:ribosomal protein S18 acetylase RimI-like enzyme